MIVFPRLENHPYLSENIYNLAETDMFKSKEAENSWRYRSKHHSATKEQYSASKSPIPRTMGFAQTPLNSPQEYLKKHSREAKTDPNKSVTCLCRTKRGKDSPLLRCSEPTMVSNVQRNFVEDNILDVVRRPTRTPNPKLVDDKRGDNFTLETSGWVPKHSNKQDYGKVPLYIGRLKHNLRESREEFSSSEHRPSEPRKVSRESKQKILEDLVRNLKELLRRYLTLPLKIDTPVQIKRKNDLENKIDALQRDIDLIQRNKDILIGEVISPKSILDQPK